MESLARLGAGVLTLVVLGVCDVPDRAGRAPGSAGDVLAEAATPVPALGSEREEGAPEGAGPTAMASAVEAPPPEHEGEPGATPGTPVVRSGAPAARPGAPGAPTPAGGPSRVRARVGPADSARVRFPRPEHVRGLYVNAWAAGSERRMSQLLDIVRETEVNALVIDIKDATGYVSHRTEVELAHTIGATGERRIADLPGLLDRLEAEGVYPIARIVIVKDPILASHRPELAIQDTAGGVWVDSKGIVWLNPYSADVWTYHVDLAREVAEMGFPEIQWDYVRFPDASRSDLDRAVFLGAEGRERSDAIREFLSFARSGLADVRALTTADVFGVTTSYRRDVGTGQVWEKLIDVVDVALPMVYPSHYYAGSFGHDEPNAHPYEIVLRAVGDAVRRSQAVEGAGLTRPWLQDFTLGKPTYSGAEVRAQIQATYDAGVQEWVLWNPGSRYTVAALEPTDGFVEEPLVRVAGVLAPVSRRHAVLDSVAAQTSEPEPAPVVEPRAAPAGPDTIPLEPLPGDSLGGALIPGDSLGGAPIPTDSLGGPPIPIDSLGRGAGVS